ncbi:acyltransferase [Niabella sp. CC-SYL272]|uniref:acyltransferase family protein n=1 Tax=Niabella agricola TaxID=2891571 RepID=UPI001F31AFBF|nr:acyltransferase [Niabella agricola]MCF3111900.1 acyltransferase [Niabella agricola]
MLFDKLRRVTSATRYLPFIDGLRFFAILPVVLVHTVDFYEAHAFKISDTALYKNIHLASIIGNADTSVLLFFMISGFILGMPFARGYMGKMPLRGLKNYYLRRLTRLEPPYLLLLTLLFILNVYLLHNFSFEALFPHYVASFFYVHDIVYKSHSFLNFVFWSLEIEVQFYLLAPLLVAVFKLKPLYRRLILLAAILVFSVFNSLYRMPFLSIINYLQFFLAGFFVLDIYLTTRRQGSVVFDLLATVFFLLFWTSTVTREAMILPFLLMAFFLTVIHSKVWVKILSVPSIAIIGGMCYSIYMIHYPVMVFVMNRLRLLTPFFDNFYADFFIKLLLCLLAVGLAGATYFVVVEKPFMKWKLKTAQRDQQKV